MMLCQVVPADKLRDLSRYYSSLSGMWYCTVTVIEQAGNIHIVYFPLYFDNERHQAKLWWAVRLQRAAG